MNFLLSNSATSQLEFFSNCLDCLIPLTFYIAIALAGLMFLETVTRPETLPVKPIDLSPIFETRHQPITSLTKTQLTLQPLPVGAAPLDLSKLTIRDLKKLARDHSIQRYSKLTKAELIERLS